MYSETKKKTPNIASATRRMAMFAPVKVLFRKSERSSIGSRWWVSSSTKATSMTAATTNAPTIRPDVHP